MAFNSINNSPLSSSSTKQEGDEELDLDALRMAALKSMRRKLDHQVHSSRSNSPMNYEPSNSLTNASPNFHYKRTNFARHTNHHHQHHHHHNQAHTHGHAIAQNMTMRSNSNLIVLTSHDKTERFIEPHSSNSNDGVNASSSQTEKKVLPGRFSRLEKDDSEDDEWSEEEMVDDNTSKKLEQLDEDAEDEVVLSENACEISDESESALNEDITNGRDNEEIDTLSKNEENNECTLDRTDEIIVNINLCAKTKVSAIGNESHVNNSSKDTAISVVGQKKVKLSTATLNADGDSILEKRRRKFGSINSEDTSPSKSTCETQSVINTNHVDVNETESQSKRNMMKNKRSRRNEETQRVITAGPSLSLRSKKGQCVLKNQDLRISILNNTASNNTNNLKRSEDSSTEEQSGKKLRSYVVMK